jgi:AraC-like DNA-binding protein
MPSSAIRATADLEEYVAAIRPRFVEVTVTARGRFAASIVRIDLQRLWMQRGREQLPRIWYAKPSAERKIISFLTEAGGGAIRNGNAFGSGQIALHSPGRAYQHRSLGPLGWAAMSLPAVDMAEISATLAGQDLMPQHDEEIVTPAAEAMAKLQRLHAAAGHLAEYAPEVIASPEAARGLEEALIEAMVDCILAPDRREDTAAQRRHTAIMQRFHMALEASDGVAVYLPELCKKIGVSGRTLRLCCQDHLGLSPKRYLLLRRMHFARRALREASPGDTTVTDVATQFGFWELGRFAVEYKTLFGESPSETLRRSRW